MQMPNAILLQNSDIFNFSVEFCQYYLQFSVFLYPNSHPILNSLFDVRNRAAGMQLKNFFH